MRLIATGLVASTLTLLAVGCVVKRQPPPAADCGGPGRRETPFRAARDKALAGTGILSTRANERMSHLAPGEACGDEPSVGVLVFRDTQSVQCTATLIRSDAIITAAHCLQGVDESKLDFVLGLNAGSASARIPLRPAAFKIPVSYTLACNNSDVAVALLSKRSAVPPAALLDSAPAWPKTLVYIGYGYSEFNGHSGIGTKRCTNLEADRGVGDSIHARTKHPQVCGGDSGGPAFLATRSGRRLVGVTSWGDASCEGTVTSVALDVHHDWIDASIESLRDTYVGPEVGCLELEVASACREYAGVLRTECGLPSLGQPWDPSSLTPQGFACARRIGGIEALATALENVPIFCSAERSSVTEKQRCEDVKFQVQQARVGIMGGGLMPIGAMPAFTPKTITGSGKYKARTGGFERGRQTTMYCGNNPESWVRGDASFDTGSGDLSVTIELETDSVGAGPKGNVSISIKDDAGNAIATVESSDIGIGGKPPGKAISRPFGSRVTIKNEVARRASAVTIEANCRGSAAGLWGINPDDPNQAFTLTVTYPG